MRRTYACSRPEAEPNLQAVAAELVKRSHGGIHPVKQVGPHDFREQDYKENISILDYAQIAAVLTSLPVAVTMSVLVSRFNWARGKRWQTIRESAWESTMEYVASRSTWTQLHLLTPVRPLRVELSLNVYNRWQERLPGFNHYFGGDHYSARWLVEVPDRRPEDPVILYMHGGSYALKVQRPQIVFMAKLASKLKASRVSVLVLDYTIGPCAKHPTQLDEASACYDDLSRTCNNIIYFGDSAGGHMALALLLRGRLASGVMLVSPSTDMARNTKDGASMRAVYLDAHADPTDPLISPIRADPKVWKRLIPENCATVWGSREETKQEMSEFADIAGVSSTFEEKDGTHDCMLRGLSNPGSAFIEQKLKDWLMPNQELARTPASTPPASTPSPYESQDEQPSRRPST